MELCAEYYLEKEVKKVAQRMETKTTKQIMTYYKRMLNTTFQKTQVKRRVNRALKA